MRNEYHLWTKEEIKLVITLWPDHSFKEIQKSVGVGPRQLSYLAKKIRLKGIPLEKKTGYCYPRQGSLINVINELKKELGY